MPSAPFRVARGLAVGGVGLGLALVAHGLGGGGLPPASDLLPAVPVLLGCVVAANRAFTVGRLLAALVAVQVVVHGSLWLASADAAVDPRLSGLAASQVAHVHAHGAVAGLSGGMLAAHAAAVLVAALLLAGVDDAVLVLWALGRAVLGVLPGAAATPSAPNVVAAGSRETPPRSRVLLVAPRRGPPVVAA